MSPIRNIKAKSRLTNIYPPALLLAWYTGCLMLVVHRLFIYTLPKSDRCRQTSFRWKYIHSEISKCVVVFCLFKLSHSFCLLFFTLHIQMLLYPKYMNFSINYGSDSHRIAITKKKKIPPKNKWSFFLPKRCTFLWFHCKKVQT